LAKEKAINEFRMKTLCAERRVESAVEEERNVLIFQVSQLDILSCLTLYGV